MSCGWLAHGTAGEPPRYRSAVVIVVTQGAKAGRAQGRGWRLSTGEQRALLDGLQHRRTAHLGTLIPLLLLTGMRAGEALSLAWAQVDLLAKTITVGRAKTSSGTRIIPINNDVAAILASHRSWFTEHFGTPKPKDHLFPWGKPVPADPSRDATDITWGNFVRLQVFPAASMSSGTPSSPGWLKTASLSPQCSP